MCVKSLNLFCVSLLQRPGLFCAPGQPEERHAGQHSSGAAEPRGHKVPGSKEVGASCCYHALDTRVCSNWEESRGGKIFS